MGEAVEGCRPCRGRVLVHATRRKTTADLQGMNIEHGANSLSRPFVGPTRQVDGSGHSVKTGDWGSLGKASTHILAWHYHRAGVASCAVI
jgi:hypothetical protein